MCKLYLGPTIIESSGIGPPHPANYTNYPAGCILCIFLSLFTLPSIRGCAAVVSWWQAAQAAPRCVGVASHTWGTESALRRETRPTMGDRRMVFGDGLEDIKVRGKSEKTTLSLKPRIVFLGRCRPMVEVVGDSSLGLSSSDPFSCFGFLASQLH